MSQDNEHDVRLLLDLARDKSDTGRTRLVQIVGDLFFDEGGVLSDRERALMTDILRRLIRDVEITVRKALAERLAGEASAPPDLIKALANDEIEVAHSILLKSEVLQDIELIEIIEHRTQEHQLVIAMRSTVSEAVSDALVGTGDAAVIQTLIGNLEAQISDATMENLVAESETEEAYRHPLLNRPEFSPHLAKRMYWWVSAALRSHIVENFDIDPAELDRQIEGTIKDILPQEAAGPAESGGGGGQDEADSDGITPRLLLQTLRRGEVAMFESLFAQLTGLRSKLVRRFIFEPGGEGLAIACKSVSMSKPDFGSIFLLSRSARPGDKKVDPDEVTNALTFYEHIKPETAQKVVARWKLDPDYLYAIKQVETSPKAGAGQVAAAK